MDSVNIVLCGLGGQGILFMTKILAQAYLNKGFNVMAAETHGMAQRGGSVISHLRIGDVESSLVRTGSAHLLLSLEENEGCRNLPFLSPKASMYVNTNSPDFPRQEVKEFLDKRDIIYRPVPAATIAREMDASMASNLVLLGYFSAFDNGSVSHEELRGTIGNISADRFKEINLHVFDAGHKKGMEDMQE